MQDTISFLLSLGFMFSCGVFVGGWLSTLKQRLIIGAVQQTAINIIQSFKKGKQNESIGNIRNNWNGNTERVNIPVQREEEASSEHARTSFERARASSTGGDSGSGRGASGEGEERQRTESGEGQRGST